MQIKINRNDLLDKLFVVGKALPGKSLFAPVEGIYIKKEGDTLSLCANNLEMFIRSFDENVTGEGEGATVLPKQFTQIVKQLPDSEVKITVKGNRAEIVSGNSKFKLNCLDAEEFPMFGEDYKDNPFTPSVEFEGKTLKDLIRKTTFCVANHAGNPVFSGVLMVNNPNGDGFVCVASDTYRLAWYEKVKINADEPFEILVPGKLLAEVGKVVKDDDTVKAYITEKEIVFVVSEYVIAIRLLEGKYPNFSHIFPANAKTEIKVNKQNLASMLNRAELLASGYSKMFNLRVTDVLEAEVLSEMGNMNEELAIDVKGEQLEEIVLNAKFILDGAKVFDGEDLDIEFNGILGPVVMKEEGFKYLVLPIKKN